MYGIPVSQTYTSLLPASPLQKKMPIIYPILQPSLDSLSLDQNIVPYSIYFHIVCFIGQTLSDASPIFLIRFQLQPDTGQHTTQSANSICRHLKRICQPKHIARLVAALLKFHFDEQKIGKPISLFGEMIYNSCKKGETLLWNKKKLKECQRTAATKRVPPA